MELVISLSMSLELAKGLQVWECSLEVGPNHEPEEIIIQ